MIRSLILFSFLILSFSVNAQAPVTYNYYYGNLHSHSAYSDGNQDSVTSGHTTPFQNFVYADGALHMDFLGVSEHNHPGAGMKKANYAKGLSQALAATNAQFVALYGMEWGVISTGGHLLVYGVDQLLGWNWNNYDVFVAQTDYQNLFRQINKRPGAFAMLAHPNFSDYGGLANTGTPFSLKADSAIVGSVMRSGPASSTNTTYSNPAFGTYEAYFRAMLAKGYHLGITLDHDNHNTTFGRTTDGRLVALAPALSRADLMEAFRARRFYASDDWNTQVDFTLNNNPMGSIFSGTDPAGVNINVTDGDAENFQSITLMRGVPGSGQLSTQVAAVTGNTTSLSYVNNDFASAYYYAVIIQNDGDRIMTSPVWYTRTNATGVQEEANTMALKVYPNPAFGEGVNISYYLSRHEEVSLDVLDGLGRVVTILVSKERQTSGSYSYSLNPNILNLKSGIYTIRFVSNGKVSYKRLVL